MDLDNWGPESVKTNQKPIHLQSWIKISALFYPVGDWMWRETFVARIWSSYSGTNGIIGAVFYCAQMDWSQTFKDVLMK